MKYLVIVRAGDDSLHPNWKTEVDVNFDIFVSYYGAHVGNFQDGADHYASVPGLKYPIIARHLEENPDLLSQYDAFWFPDDDIWTSQVNISRMFDIFHEYDLSLAQPAMTADSFQNRRRFFVRQEAILRYTNFVEIMCPIFSRKALEELLHTFSVSPSGWGLDYVWTHLIGNPTRKIAIIDLTPVRHTRPYRQGTFYEKCSSLGITAAVDYRRVLRRYGIYPPPEIRIYEEIARRGTV